jgi:FKBP-type peptidyl-prolyl cis-trans isomerase
MKRTRLGSAALLLCFACTTSATDSKDHQVAKATASEVKEHSRPYDSKALDAKAGDQKSLEDAKAMPPRGTQVPPPDDVAAAPADAKKTPSGLAYKVLSQGPGAGDHPTANDSVKVAYTGWTTDGATFDTTSDKQPRTFAVGKVIPGWTEAIQLMKVGDKMKFWIPEELAYKGRKGAPAGMLVFEVELLEIIAAPKAPEDIAAPPADAKKTKSGLAYKVLAAGDGKEKPRAWDRVKVDYSGWTTDGNMFDSSVQKGRPLTIEVNKVIPGWTEGLQLMKQGDSMRFWIPEELAYKGKPGPQGMLVFDVKLHEIEKLPEPPPPPKAPKDVAAAPKDATKTESGLAYKVLQKGKGTEKPTAENTVKVHYTGWTTDGEMFDSSVVRGEPAEFPLGRVIKGWTEGVQLMVVGEKTRFWIPKELAYNDQPGKPAGMLVFDVELLEIKPAK